MQIDEIAGAQLVKLHYELNEVCRNLAGREFISGWETDHPYAAEYLPALSSGEAIAGYSFLADSVKLNVLIQQFHEANDGVGYADSSIYVSAGSSPLLLAFFMTLRERGIQEIYYAPPIYYSCYYFAAALGLRLIKVSREPLNLMESELLLPGRKTVLLFCDPVWVMGQPVHKQHMAKIAEWQDSTGSTVMVDGTFQYTKWAPGDRREQTSGLDRDLTYRVICPTKSLAVHGARFAYALMPSGWHWDIHHACSVITGANGSHAEAQAVRLMEVLNSAESNRRLARYIEQRYKDLRDSGVIVTEVAEPCASYYTFAKISAGGLSNTVTMDQRYFDLTSYEGYVRLNLLHPVRAANLIHVITAR
jgi:aspartate/methionine/tyrosine aminotransferase